MIIFLRMCLCVCGFVCVPYIVNHQVHDGLGDEVPDCAVDDGQVRVHQVPDDLHLSLQLRIHAVDLPVSTRLLCLRLHKHGFILVEDTNKQKQRILT